jgi:hypothetical protein
MKDVEIINSEQEVLIEAANTLYAADILSDENYSGIIDRIQSSIKDNEDNS